MVRNYTDAELLERVKSLKSFKYMPKYLIIGVRSKADIPDTFDDKFYLFIDSKFVAVTTGTTHPGGPILGGGWKSYNKNGAAIVKADEIYYNVYRYGLHKGRMPALRQIRNMLYYRDNDNDKKVDASGILYADNYNTNFHANSYSAVQTIVNGVKDIIGTWFKTDKIGNWSAGCQVVNDAVGYDLFITKTMYDEKGNHPEVTYALLNEW